MSPPDDPPADSGQQRLADLPLTYDELRSLAEHLLWRRSSWNGPRATSLVHEAWLRLSRLQGMAGWSHGHILAVAAKAMRCVLVDHARRVQSRKRGGGRTPVPLDDGLRLHEPRPDTPFAPATSPAVELADLLALDEALKRLADLDERKARIVELRFFGGLSIEETAEVAACSSATVKREWAVARAWLYREIEGAPRGPT